MDDIGRLNGVEMLHVASKVRYCAIRLGSSELWKGAWKILQALRVINLDSIIVRAEAHGEY
jgi:hypothetical protein